MGERWSLKFDSISFQNMLSDKTSLNKKEKNFYFIYIVFLFSPFPSVWYASGFYHSMYGKHLLQLFQLVHFMMKLAVYRYLNYLCIVSRLNKNQFNVLNIEIVCSNSLSYMEIVELAVLVLRLHRLWVHMHAYPVHTCI